MIREQLYNRVGKSKNTFLLFAIIIVLFYSGISFTFVIPGLKGFSISFFALTLAMYFIAGNIFVGLFKDKVLLVFLNCIILSTFGMGWRLWLEWGEFSLVEHTSLVVYIGYPTINAMIITLFYIIGNPYLGRKSAIYKGDTGLK